MMAADLTQNYAAGTAGAPLRECAVNVRPLTGMRAAWPLMMQRQSKRRLDDNPQWGHLHIPTRPMVPSRLPTDLWPDDCKGKLAG